MMVEQLITKEPQDEISQKRLSTETLLPNQHDMELNFVCQKLESLQNLLLQDVKQRITVMIDDVLEDMRQQKLQSQEFRNFANFNQQQQNEALYNNLTANSDIQNEKLPSISSEISAENKQSRHRTLSSKVFVTRESYLTALLEVPHMKAIYNIFFSIILALCLQNVVFDYYTLGSINLSRNTFQAGLARIHLVLGIWCLEQLLVFSLYFAFKFWARIRHGLLEQPYLLNFWSYSCLLIYISSQLALAYIASTLCQYLSLPFISAAVLLLESCRLLMKMHAFIRSNVPRVVAAKLKTHNTSREPKIAATLPAFSSYIYFLFAPTLIYRDSYPRTHQIRWRFALARFLEVCGVAFTYSFIYESHLKALWLDFGLHHSPTAYEFLLKFFNMLLPSTIILLCGFYLILHAWLNFTAELLRFGDRMFYKDWWTVGSFDAYFRTWNIVVHDWLYEYIYKDAYNYLFRGSRLGASLFVFFVSGLAHEHMVGFALQLFLPCLFIFFFGVAVPLVFLTPILPKNIGNIILWLSLIFGNGLMFSIYCMEYNARYNCPKTYRTLSDYLMPAFMECYKTVHASNT